MKSAIQFVALLTVGLLVFTSLKSYADVCPTAPTRVKPLVTVKVDRVQQGGLYNYQYTVSNGRGAEVPLMLFMVYLNAAASNIKSPPKSVGDWNLLEKNSPRISWPLMDRIKEGATVSGFSFESPNPPGTVIFGALGDSGEVPSSTPTADDDEPEPDCPEFYFDKPFFESLVLGVTTGPVPSTQVSGEILIRNQAGAKVAHIEPMDSGTIQVLLLGSDNLDVTKVEIASLEFGMGKAKPKMHKLLLEGKKKDLLLHFDLDEVNVRCGLDHALFLMGKVDGKNLLAGAPIDAVKCRPEHFVRQDKRAKAIEERLKRGKKSSAKDRGKK